MIYCTLYYKLSYDYDRNSICLDVEYPMQLKCNLNHIQLNVNELY